MSARERNPLTLWPLRTSLVLAAAFAVVAWYVLHLQGRTVDPYRLIVVTLAAFLFTFLRARHQHASHLARKRCPDAEVHDG